MLLVSPHKEEMTDNEAPDDLQPHKQDSSSLTSDNQLRVCCCLCSRAHSHMDDSGVRSNTHVTDRVDEAGSVVCLCMRCVRRRKCSLMDSCTSVGMSGDVWLIFTAASRKPIEPTGSFTFSVAMVTDGRWGLGSSGSGGCGGWRSGPREELEQPVLAGCRDVTRNFQETKARRPSRVRPKTTNTPSRRPRVASGEEPQGPGTEDHTIWRSRW